MGKRKKTARHEIPAGSKKSPSGSNPIEKLHTLIPMEYIEPEAQDQIFTNLKHDFVKRMAVMPDVHAGYDLPIGAVALTEDIISPSYVGYDIGCGMCLVDTNENASSLIQDAGGAEHIFKKIYETVPVGLGGEHKKVQDYAPFGSASGDKNLDQAINAKLNLQLGTLGSGNHFIELGENGRGNLSITIHSGSRNIGHTLCTHYMKRGRYLRLDTDDGRAYLADLNFALKYALDNRLHMIRAVLTILGFSYEQSERIISDSLINENHNHAIVTENGILHRKGATPADEGQMGVIPANMRDGVFVTRGKGAAEYLSSASHGAGRLMSRKKARSTIPLSHFEKSMEGIMARTDKGVLDEAPFAYKKIEDVISRQEGIVIDVVDRIRPLINVKG